MDSSIPVGGTGKRLETIVFENDNGTEVHREGVFIGDGESSVKAIVTASGSLQVTTDPSQLNPSGATFVAFDPAVLSPTNSLQVISDPGQLDAFYRLRVSNPQTLFDSKQIHNDGALLWDDQQVSGAGTSSTWTQDEASTMLGVANTTAGNRVRQTYRRFNYQPGKSQLILMTGTLNESGGGAGITRSFGLYNDENGFFLKDDEGTYKLVKRSHTTGATVDTEIAQSSWNIDPMDGTGPSGITLDFATSQILFMDMEWLGVGRIRMGFVVDGIPVYVHQFLHANVVPGVYMSTPNLPMRYEIANDGTGAASELEVICCTVMSEGGAQDIGINRSNTIGANPVQANTVGTQYAVCGLRLKTANPDGVVKLVNFSAVCATPDDYAWFIIFNPTIAGTPTWADEANSVVQFGTADTAGSPSTTTVTGGVIISSGFVKSGNDSGSTTEALDTAQNLGVAINGDRDEVWLVVMPLAANADIYGSLSWREIS